MHFPGMSFHFSPNDGISLIFAGPADARRPSPVEPASGGEKEDDALELDPGIGVPLGNGKNFFGYLKGEYDGVAKTPVTLDWPLS